MLNYSKFLIKTPIYNINANINNKTNMGTVNGPLEDRHWLGVVATGPYKCGTIMSNISNIEYRYINLEDRHLPARVRCRYRCQFLRICLTLFFKFSFYSPP